LMLGSDYGKDRSEKGIIGDHRESETHTKDNADKRRVGRLVEPSTLAVAPDAGEYEVWRMEVMDWHSTMSQDYGSAYVMQALLRALTTEQKRSYYKLLSDEERSFGGLMKLLDERYRGDTTLDHRRDVTAYRQFKRSGQTLKAFRVKWQELRAVVLGSGELKAAPGDAWDLLSAAELSAQQTTTILNDVKAQERESSRGAGALFDRLEATLSAMAQYEQAYEAADQNPKEAKRRREAVAFVAEFGKGKGPKGKGKGDGGRRGETAQKGGSSQRSKSVGARPAGNGECWNGDQCWKPECKWKHPNGNARTGLQGGKSKSNPGKGKGKGKGKTDGKNADWKCDGCGHLVFGRTMAQFCPSCGQKKST